MLSHALLGLNLCARHMVVLIVLSSWLCCVCRVLFTVSTLLFCVSKGHVPQVQHAGAVFRGSPGSLAIYKVNCFVIAPLCDIRGSFELWKGLYDVM